MGPVIRSIHALEQDREGFCVAGSIFSPASDFTNRMIKEGAKLVSRITDILEELNIAEVAQAAKTPSRVPEQPPVFSQVVSGEAGEQLPFVSGDGDEPTEQDLLDRLTDAPVHIDDLRRITGLPITTVSSTPTMLELKGKIKQAGCMHYIRLRETTAVYDY